MQPYNPFQIVQESQNRAAKIFKEGREQSSLDNILSEAMSSNSPDVLQSTLGKILSQVAPEKQAAAMQVVQGKIKQIKENQQQQREIQAAEEGGYNPYAPAGVQTQQVKDRNKKDRLDKYFGSETGQEGNVNPNISPTQAPISQMTDKDQLINLTGHPDREVSEPASARLKELQKEEEFSRADQRESRKETLPLKKEIIDKANNARTSIRSKKNLLQIIDRGNLDDPTYAIFAQSMPFDLGKRMLSDDTVTYKGALVDDYNDLKNVFKGATRVKEVEIYEDKLADLYLTDSQKKAILKSRIDGLQSDLIREEAALEIEEKYPNISALQFSRKVEELTKEKMDALFNNIWDDNKAVIDQAERKKNVPLDKNNPDDLQIMIQIKQEAGGDPKKALEIAKKKGYKFK